MCQYSGMVWMFVVGGLIGVIVTAFVMFLLRTRRHARGSQSEEGASPFEMAGSSFRDPVTGLYDRGHLLRRLTEGIARARRDGQRLAVLLWDIDGFERFNSAFGQKEGDRFLARVAEVIRGAVRAYDEVFRSGPDEFCAILYPADEKLVESVLARVAEDVARAWAAEPLYAERSFAIPVGFAFYPGKSELPEALLYEAGERLFQARA